MKTKIKGLLILVVSLCTLQAQAAVPEGFFRGASEVKKGDTYRLFLKAIKSGDDVTSYGVLLNEKDETVAVYKVEEIQPTLLGFTQIIQTDRQILGVNSAMEFTYSAILTKDAKGRQSIELTPTAYGLRIKCAGEIMLQEVAGSSNSWDSTPTAGAKYEGSRGRLDSTGALMNGKFQITQRTVNGNFNVTSIFEGLQVVRAQVLSSQSASGVVVEKTITAVALYLRGGSRLGGASSELRLVEMGSNQESCGYASIGLARK